MSDHQADDSSLLVVLLKALLIVIIVTAICMYLIYIGFPKFVDIYTDLFKEYYGYTKY
jgi:hypothetical protein